MTRSSCHDTQRKILTPLPDDFLRKTPKRRLPGGSIRNCGDFRHFFVYISHFPQKSKLYGEIKRYFCHAGPLILGQVVNAAAPTHRWAAVPSKKLNQISPRSPDWGRSIDPCRTPPPRTWSPPAGSS